MNKWNGGLQIIPAKEYYGFMDSKTILFFDGHCNLCNGFIDFVVRRDKHRKTFIASLQGKTAEKMLPPERIKTLNSVVLLHHQEIYLKSSAIFKLAMILGGPLLLFLPFWIIPRFFTNWVYDWVALSRYRLFGRRETCRIPTEEEKQHFLP